MTSALTEGDFSQNKSRKGILEVRAELLSLSNKKDKLVFACSNNKVNLEV